MAETLKYLGENLGKLGLGIIFFDGIQKVWTTIEKK